MGGRNLCVSAIVCFQREKEQESTTTRYAERSGGQPPFERRTCRHTHTHTHTLTLPNGHLPLIQNESTSHDVRESRSHVLRTAGTGGSVPVRSEISIDAAE